MMKKEDVGFGTLKVLEGNKVAACGILLCRPDVIAVYPITPQTSLVEKLCDYCAEGFLDSELVEVEGENSAMAACIGASAAGGRTFTATSSMGLNFMFDSYVMASGIRAPVVMVNVNRDQQPPTGPFAGEQDIMTVRDAGWVHIHAENCQDILDSVIMAYRLAEDPEILLPVTVAYDGFYLSYQAEGVHIPTQEEVDRFLLPVSEASRPVLIGPEGSMNFGICPTSPEVWTEYRYKHQAAMERVKTKVVEITSEFERVFHRNHGELIEEYRTEDAEIVMVCLGSHTGTARTVVDAKREEGIKVGLVKIRVFRPFPRERLGEALQHKKGIGVIDRSVAFGCSGGHVFNELQVVLADLGHRVPTLDFIGGLGGADITKAMITSAVEKTHQAARGMAVPEVTWLSLE
jgi:pyruvate/2-oxoacid:ferredoxin oxidoreductase alpha subunit